MFISDCYNYACAFSDWLQLTLQRPPLFAEPPLYGEFNHRGPQKWWAIQALNTAFLFTSTLVDSTIFAAKIKCHGKTLDSFKGRKQGEKIMSDRKNEASAERL